MTRFENKFMRMAINEAYKAKENGDVPVGAVVVSSGEVISSGYNTREADQNLLGHAEVSAIEAACKKRGNWRLDDCDLYVTLEPCLMCTSVIMQSRIRRVYFGAYDKERGFVASNEALKPQINFEYYCGIMEDECTRLLDSFFKEIRE